MLTNKPHLREQFLAEYFRRRSIAEALSWCRGEPVADVLQVAIGDRKPIYLSRKPFASTAIGVLDRAFLPRRLRVAEPCLRSYAGPEIRPFAEFGAAVKGNRPAGEMGKGLQRLDQPVHDRTRLAVVVAQEDGKPAESSFARTMWPARKSLAQEDGR